MDQKINLLEKIGLTESESKVYLALVQHGTKSGYEASKLSMVPRSKIYNILESLVNKGFVLFSENEGNNRYASVPIEEIAERIKHETEDTLESLSEKLKEHATTTDLDYIWRIRTYKNVFAKCRTLIKEAQTELLVQVWEVDLPEILEPLKAMEENGVLVGLVCFSENEALELPFENYCIHGMLEEKRVEMGGRFITLVSDRREVVFGQIIDMSSAEVIWTESRPMISMAAECVRHDMYFYKSAGLLGSEMKEKFGKDYSRVREIFTHGQHPIK